MAQVLQRQTDIGLDFINDWDQSWAKYPTYVIDGLTGFEGERPHNLSSASWYTTWNLGTDGADTAGLRATCGQGQSNGGLV